MAGTASKIHATVEPNHSATKELKKMAAERRTSNWNLANLRFALVQGVIVAIIGIGSVYTTNLLTQQALAAKVDNLQIIIDERNKARDQQLADIKATLADKVATREILDLKLQPVRDQLAAQQAILEQIRTAVLLRPPREP